MNPKVDAYIEREKPWQEEVTALRRVILGCGLTEELKWGSPCYTHEGSNIVLIHTFKEYCAVLFFKGALLPDPNGVLIQQTENVQAARQIRFTDMGEVAGKEDDLIACIREAVKVEEAGLEVEFKETKEFEMPEEFRTRLDASPELKAAFEALTPGRQRGYLLHFSGAKRSSTRESRIDRNIDNIMDGKGLQD